MSNVDSIYRVFKNLAKLSKIEVVDKDGLLFNFSDSVTIENLLVKLGFKSNDGVIELREKFKATKNRAKSINFKEVYIIYLYNEDKNLVAGIFYIVKLDKARLTFEIHEEEDEDDRVPEVSRKQR